MVGLKLGSKVLQVDGRDVGLIAALAGAAGLSGQASAVATDQARAEGFEHAAASAGVLVEIIVSPLGALPYDAESFDVVVVKDVLGELNQNTRVKCLQQIYRVLRPGGRCLVIDQAMRGGLGALFARPSSDRRYAAAGPQAALKAEGFQGVRLLAERNGKTFTEATKGTTDPGL